MDAETLLIQIFVSVGTLKYSLSWASCSWTGEAKRSSVTEPPLMVWRVVGSIPHNFFLFQPVLHIIGVTKAVVCTILSVG